MNRRGFLKFLGIGAVAALFAPAVMKPEVNPTKGGWYTLRWSKKIIEDRIEEMVKSLQGISNEQAKLIRQQMRNSCLVIERSAEDTAQKMLLSSSKPINWSDVMKKLPREPTTCELWQKECARKQDTMAHFQRLYAALNDHDQAIAALKGKVIRSS